MLYVELFNLVDKQRVPLNPNPGKGGPGDEFAQRGSKESLQFAFSFSVPGGRMAIDLALGNMRPELDQLPGSCKNWMPVGRWIDISNDDYGVTWATLDAPLVEIGGITATVLGSQRDPSVWRKHIEPTQTFYSWIMNNHWGTNYLAYQQGKVEFRYALRPHWRPNAAEASRWIEKAGRLIAFLIDDLGSKFDEHFWDVDLDRTDLVAGAAERGRVGKRLGMLHLHELRREDRADRARIDRPVSVAARLPIDGTGIHACAAANALEGLALNRSRRG